MGHPQFGTKSGCGGVTCSLNEKATLISQCGLYLYCLPLIRTLPNLLEALASRDGAAADEKVSSWVQELHCGNAG